MTDTKNLYDAVVVGGGPAGLTAALYLARARYRVLVVEKDRFGGQITITSEVVNYPGVAKISGAALGETMRKQAESFGAEFLLAEVTGIEPEGDVKTVRTTRGDIRCFGILMATGASPRRLGFEGEAEFQGHGVAYCATCDGEFFTGKDVFVIGGGFAAAEESVFLTKYARRVHILIRKGDFSCAPAACEETKRHPKIEIHPYSEVESVEGDQVLRKLRYRNSQTGEVTEYVADEGDTFGVFVLAGYVPANGLVKDIVELNPAGYILTDEHQRTSAEGIYAAGDVCVKSLRQVATATGEAALAATEMERHLKAMQDKTGLVPERPQAAPAPASAPDAAEPAPAAAASESGLFTQDMIDQLNTVFARMDGNLVLKVYPDARPVSTELEGYMNELASLTGKLTVQVQPLDPDADDAAERPYVRVCSADGADTGLAFHGVPGGHEFTSFVLGLYNAAGPGQPIADGDRSAAEGIDEELGFKVLVGLSCTMCPDVVVATQRIASLNPKVRADVYDINHFGDLRDAYHAMSVPCLVVQHADGSEKVSFGKKNIGQVLELAAQA